MGKEILYSEDKYPVFLGASVIEKGDNLVTVNSANGLFTIKGSYVVKYIEKVEGFDGTRSFYDIVSKLNEEEVKNLDSVLDKFLDMGLINILDNRLDENKNRFFKYLSRYIKNSEETMLTIVNKTIAIYSKALNKDFVYKLKENLYCQGFNNIAIFKDEDELKEIIKNVSLVISPVYEEDEYPLLEISEICMENKTPWFPIIFSKEIIKIGPFVSPQESACLGCYYKKINKVLVEKKELWRAGDYFIPVSIESIVVGLVVEILSQLLGKYRSSTYWGKIVTLNMNNMNIDKEVIYKNYECECYGTSPRVKRWEYEL